MVVKNTLISFICQLLITLAFLFQASILTIEQGIEVYGVVASAILLSYRGVLPAALMGVSDFLIYSDAGKDRSILKVTSFFLWATGCIFIAFLSIISINLVYSYDINIFYIFFALLQLQLILIRARITALHHIWIVKIGDTFSALVFVLVTVFTKNELEYEFIYSLITFVAVLEVILIILISKYARLNIFLNQKKYSRQLFDGFSLFALRSFTSIGGSYADRLIVNAMLGSAVYGIYDLILRLPRLLKTSGGLVQAVLFPWMRRGFNVSIDDFFIHLHKLKFYLFILFCALCFFFILNITTVNEFLYGDILKPYKALIVAVIVTMMLGSVVNFPYSILISANLRAKELTAYSFVTSILKVFFSLMGYFYFGFEGIVYGHLLISIISWIYVSYIYYSEVYRCCRIDSSSFFWELLILIFSIILGLIFFTFINVSLNSLILSVLVFAFFIFWIQFRIRDVINLI